MIYMVENGFADPSREDAWSTWYSGHVKRAFLGIPGWRSGQRFAAVPPTQPKFRAFYTVDTAAVLESPEYKATTGGRFPDEWRGLITSFHRNLADGDWMPAVAAQQRLVVVDAPATGEALPGVALQWWSIVGLDRSIERRAIAVVDDAAGSAIAARAISGVGVYAPLFDRYVVS
jgi:hypothetical protein